MNFSQIDNDEDMQNYLRRVLERTGNIKQTEAYLYHYTDIDSLASIIVNKYLWLGSYSSMNDPFEKRILDEKGKEGRLFFTSFSKAEESLALYEKYCQDIETGAILKISFSDMNKIINTKEFNENTEGMYNDGRYNHTRRSFRIVRNKEVINSTVNGDIYCGAIAYYDPKKKVLKTGTRKNGLLTTPFAQQEMAGFVKYSCWGYEEEVRLFVYLEDRLNLGERIAVPLKDVVSNVEIITSPYFNRELESNRDAIFQLREYGIVINSSQFEDVV